MTKQMIGLAGLTWALVVGCGEAGGSTAREKVWPTNSNANALEENGASEKGASEGAPIAAANDGAPVIDVLDCATNEGYTVSTHRAQPGSDTEVNVIGVYETRSDHHGADYHPTGEASVRVSRHAKQILVLSSYEPTRWTVTLDPGVKIEKIVTVGFYDQVVDAPSNVVVEKASTACGYSWPYNGEGCDTNELFASATKAAQGPLAAFAGCYRATKFEVRDDGQAQGRVEGEMPR
jgi:hypothetical protein